MFDRSREVADAAQILNALGPYPPDTLVPGLVRAIFLISLELGDEDGATLREAAANFLLNYEGDEEEETNDVD